MLYQTITKYKVYIASLSLLNLIFLKVWIFNNLFNINNYFSLRGIDYRISILNLIFFFSFLFVLLLLIKFFVKKQFISLLNIFYFFILLLAFNSLRASLNIEVLTLNSNLKIIFFLIFFSIFLLIFIRLKFFAYIEKIYFFVGFLFFPFFLIILFTLFFNLLTIEKFNNDLFYNDRSGDISFEKLSKNPNKVFWIIFDQYDLNIINKNLDKLNNYKYLSSKSDNYTNFTPIAGETITAVPSVLTGKKFENYKLFKKNKKIELMLFEKGNNEEIIYSKKNTIFSTLFRQKFNIYINGWYLPYCDLYKSVYYKCFQSLYGYETTFEYYTLKNYFIFVMTKITPGSNFFIKKFKLKKLYKITQDGAEFEVAKKNYLESKNSFFSNLNDSNIDFFFLHSTIPHPPYIYDTKNEIVGNYSDRDFSYQDNLILSDIFLGDFLNKLKEKQIFESSLIIVHGDTGLGEIAAKSTISERMGTTPLLIKKPYQIKSKNINKIVYSNDLIKIIYPLLNN